MSKIEQAAQQARTLFNSRCEGVLSTLSVDVPGYPFGSITPYCLNNEGQPVILISTIAQHTRNISADRKVSLIAYDPSSDDSQATGRITYIADALPIVDEQLAERYYRYYPQSRNFHKTHDFNFYVLDCVRVRYIGGFGDIYWLEKEQFQQANPFSFEEESSMIEHMNSDHQDAINHYCDLFAIPYDIGELPSLVGIDAEGFHLRVSSLLHRIEFEQQVNDVMEVRKALVDLAKRPL